MACRSVKSKIIVYILFIKLNKCITTYSTPLSIGINADILSVSDTVWRTNNVLEVSHQHLQMHMQNRHNPDPWVFLSNYIFIYLILEKKYITILYVQRG